MLHLNSKEFEYVCSLFLCCCSLFLCYFIWWRTWHEIYIANICLFCAFYIACMTFMSPPIVKLSWLHVWMIVCVYCKLPLCAPEKLFIWMTSLIQYIFSYFLHLRASIFSSFSRSPYSSLFYSFLKFNIHTWFSTHTVFRQLNQHDVLRSILKIWRYTLTAVWISSQNENVEEKKRVIRSMMMSG